MAAGAAGDEDAFEGASGAQGFGDGVNADENGHPTMIARYTENLNALLSSILRP